MVTLPEIFQDGMTLQCEKPIYIWGECDTSEMIRVIIDGKIIVEKFVNAGKFEFYLPAQLPAENRTVEINEVILKRVDFGEVWIAGGQSNMEFLLRYDQRFEELKQVSEDEHMRYYDVEKYCFEGEKEEGISENEFWNRWMHFEPETMEHFSAVGFAFARELRKKYKRPVAIIGCNWGGTTASAWLDKNMLTGNLDVYLKDCKRNEKAVDRGRYFALNKAIRRLMATEEQKEFSDELMYGGKRFDAYQKRIQGKESGWDTLGISEDEFSVLMQQTGEHDKNRPGGLHQMMQQKIAGYSVKGVIWYQGEADDHHAELYAELFMELIKCWRTDWKEELPFLFVQLAPFGSWRQCNGKQFPVLRKQQEYVAEHMKDTYMISSSDLGDEFDIHPKEKQPIGYRLALSAEKNIYHSSVCCDYPKGIGLKVEEGKCSIIFKNGKGLYVAGQVLNAMRIIINGKEYKDWQYQIEEECLVLLHTEITCKNNIIIQFAQTPYYKVNLYNESKIPAIPFELTYKL